jgi:nitrogen regulatory protein PII
MKLIIAIIGSDKFEGVREALQQKALYFMTVSEVLDFRADQTATEIYRGRIVRRPQTKYKLEIAVEDDSSAEVLQTIGRVCG